MTNDKIINLMFERICKSWKSDDVTAEDVEECLIGLEKKYKYWNTEMRCAFEDFEMDKLEETLLEIQGRIELLRWIYRQKIKS